jgi:hypothetical protein
MRSVYLELRFVKFMATGREGGESREDCVHWSRQSFAIM